jgi:hypothetical protein
VCDPDPDKSARVLKAMYGMKKIIIRELRSAYDGAALAVGGR